MAVMDIARIFALALIGGFLVAWKGVGPVKVMLLLLRLSELKLENTQQFNKSYCDKRFNSHSM